LVFQQLIFLLRLKIILVLYQYCSLLLKILPGNYFLTNQIKIHI